MFHKIKYSRFYK